MCEKSPDLQVCTEGCTLTTCRSKIVGLRFRRFARAGDMSAQANP
jgi:hypothetical protein